MAELELSAGGAKDPGDVAIAVVAHHATNDDAAGRKPGEGPTEKSGTGRGELVGQHLDVGDATVIIDGHVDILPSHTSRAPLPVAVDAMPHTSDHAERLDIHVDEIAGRWPLVA